MYKIIYNAIISPVVLERNDWHNDDERDLLAIAKFLGSSY